MENNRLFELADELKALRERKDALEAELKQVNMDIDNVDWHLSNLMGEMETQNFTRAGTMFFLSTKTRASAKAGQKDELFGALRANRLRRSDHGDDQRRFPVQLRQGADRRKRGYTARLAGRPCECLRENDRGRKKSPIRKEQSNEQ